MNYGIRQLKTTPPTLKYLTTTQLKNTHPLPPPLNTHILIFRIVYPPQKGQDPPRFEIHTQEAITQPTKTANLYTALTSQLRTSNSLEIITHNTVTVCKQLMLRCMGYQHLNTCILY